MKKILIAILMLLIAAPLFSGQYGKMVDGKLIKRTATDNVKRDKLTRGGYKPIIDVVPALNINQRLAGFVVVEKPDRFERQYQIESIPARDLYGRKIRNKIIKMQRAAAIAELKKTGDLPADYKE